MELEVKTNVKIKKTTEIKFEAGVKGDCYFKVTIDPREKENVKVRFSGLLVTATLKASIGRTGSSDEPKKLDPIKLIPSVTKSIPIKFD